MNANLDFKKRRSSFDAATEPIYAHDAAYEKQIIIENTQIH